MVRGVRATPSAGALRRPAQAENGTPRGGFTGIPGKRHLSATRNPQQSYLFIHFSDGHALSLQLASSDLAGPGRRPPAFPTRPRSSAFRSPRILPRPAFALLRRTEPNFPARANQLLPLPSVRAHGHQGLRQVQAAEVRLGVSQELPELRRPAFLLQRMQQGSGAGTHPRREDPKGSAQSGEKGHRPRWRVMGVLLRRVLASCRDFTINRWSSRRFPNTARHRKSS